MNKKPFWKRCNRGFVVSMALLAAVLVYVLAGIVILFPEKKQLRAMASDVATLVEQQMTFKAEQLEALKTDEGLAAEQQRIINEIRPLFWEETEYLQPSGALLAGLGQQIAYNGFAATEVERVGTDNNACTINEDVATVSVRYRLQLTGRPIDGESKDEQTLSGWVELTLLCKKVDGEWKIFNISNACTSYDMTGGWMIR